MGFSDRLLRIIVSLVLFALVTGEVYARWAYSNWSYEFNKQGLKTERGIIWKQYSSIPYERIQNVDIHRGVVARIFGFSSLQIQTAGAVYTGKAGIHAEGYIPAIEPKKAEAIREKLMKHISSKGM